MLVCETFDASADMRGGEQKRQHKEQYKEPAVDKQTHTHACTYIHSSHSSIVEPAMQSVSMLYLSV